MYDNGRPSSSSRSTLLSVIFGMMVAGGIFAFGLMVMGLFFLQALGIVAVLVAFGFVHYFVWGNSLSKEVEGEREFLEETAPPDEDWPPEPPRTHRRF